MKEHMKKIKTKRFGIILFVLVAVAVTIFFSSYAIFGELEAQLEQNLEDVATQNALALHNKIHSNYELLQSLSKNMMIIIIRVKVNILRRHLQIRT